MKTQRILLALFLLAIQCHPAFGVDRAVKQGGTGNGSDWNNALGDFPATFNRNDIYYVVPGEYFLPGAFGPYALNTPFSGTTPVTIKRASAAAHGPATGWSNSFTNGQVRFNAIEYKRGYLDVDGLFRDESNPPFSWLNPDGYGIWWKAPNQYKYSIINGTQSQVTDAQPHRGVLRNVRFGRATGVELNDTNGTAIYCANNSGIWDPWLIEKCGFLDVGMSCYHQEDFWIMDKCAFWRTTQKTTYRMLGNTKTNIIRNSIFWDCGIKSTDESGGNTSLIHGMGWPENNDVQIYGNIFGCSGNYPTIGHQNGVIFGGPWAPWNPGVDIGRRWRVYNNVFYNMGQLTSAGKIIQVALNGPNNFVCNNAWLNNFSPSAVGYAATANDGGTGIISNNWFYPYTDGRSTSLLGSGDIPFVNPAAGNFQPKDPANVSGNDIVNRGVGLPTGYDNIDMFGNQRGLDGTVDIGPIEYGGTAPPTDNTAPTVPVNLAATAISQSQINLAWSSSTDTGAGVAFYTIRRNNSQVGTSIIPSFQDTGLTSGTLYSYRVTATDAASPANTSAESTAATATTLAPDTTAPSKPTNLTVTATSSSTVFFTWWPSTDNVDTTPSYSILRGGVTIGTSTATNFTDTGLASATSYSYSVRAFDDPGNLSIVSASTNVTTLAAPAFPSDMALWLKADVGISLSESLIYQWADQSGNNRHAVQNTLGNQPRVQTTSSNTTDVLNGLPVLFFDGTNDFMTFDLAVNGLTAMTIFITAANTEAQVKGGTEAERAAIFWNETGSWGTVYLSPFQTEVNFRFGTTQSGNRFTYTRPATITNDFTTTCSVHNGTTDTLFVNRNKVITQGGRLATIAATSAVGNIGRGYNDNTYFAGNIAEILVYTRALSDGEVESVYAYLDGKYVAPTDVVNPTAPSSLVATAISTTQINLTWVAGTDANGIHHYNVTTNGVQYTTPTTITGTSLSVTGLVPNTSYIFAVVAVDPSMNMSASSATDTEATPATPAPSVNPMQKLRTGQSIGPVLSR